MSRDQNRPKRATLADVAKIAGVSIPTVSHVLRQNSKVTLPESTRKRVMDAANSIGYRPNLHAQAIRGGKTNMISVWMPMDRPIMTYLRMLQFISEEASLTGHELIIAPLDRDSALGTDAKPPSKWPVDGVLSIDSGKAIEAFRRDPFNDSTPVSILGYEEVKNGDSVAWDVLGGAKQVTQRLINGGAKVIVHLTMNWIVDDFPRERRRRGYSEAMEEAGLEPVIVGCTGESGSSICADVRKYLDEHGVPDAFTGMTDSFAIGAIRALLERGVTVPDDCQIWGFGDYPEGEDFSIPISTLRIPLPAVIRQAWRWLGERVEDPTLEGRFAELPMEIVSRSSTRS